LPRDELSNSLLNNKQDLPNAISAAQMAEDRSLAFSPLATVRRWHIQSAYATTGEGRYEGLDWLCTNVNIKVCLLCFMSF
ncbi:hypothetical protein BAE44_0015077, partial [Dichanthelium oligosanthes]